MNEGGLEVLSSPDGPVGPILIAQTLSGDVSLFQKPRFWLANQMQRGIAYKL